jgi:hypothetical protein
MLELGKREHHFQERECRMVLNPRRFHAIAATIVLLSCYLAVSTFAGTATFTGLASPLTQPAHFAWTTAGADIYCLYIGTTPGAFDVYWEYQETNTSKDVYGLPHDGRTLYCTIWSRNSGVWTSNSAVTTAINNSINDIAVMTVPTDGSTIVGTQPINFQWNAPDPGFTANQYWLYLGSSPGASDYFYGDQGLNTQKDLNGFPTTAQTVYMRLWTFIGGGWFYHDYSYYFPGDLPTVAALTSPTNGTSFTGDPVTFTWSSAPLATTYYLGIGSRKGAQEYYSGYQELATSKTVYGLPHDSSLIYVRLWTLVSSTWYYRDYTFTAWGGGTEGIAVMTSPVNGEQNVNLPAQFTWAPGVNGTEYWLYIGSGVGLWDYYNQAQGTNTTASVSGLLADTPIFVRLWTHVGPAWYFHDYTYKTAP